VTFSFLWQEFLRHTVEAEGPYLRTVLDMFTRPGALITDYLDGRRVLQYNPGKFLFINTTLFLVFITLAGVDLVGPELRAQLNPDAAHAIDLFIGLAAYQNFLVAVLVAAFQRYAARRAPEPRSVAACFVAQMYVGGHLVWPAFLTIAIAGADAWRWMWIQAFVLYIPLMIVIARRMHAVGWGAAVWIGVVSGLGNILVTMAMGILVQILGILYFGGGLAGT